MAGTSDTEFNKEIELGFAEELESWRLKSKYFPSKLGGKPAWLSLNPLPPSEDLKCSNCKDPLSFLMQVYAPIEENEDAFHRTLFIFVCSACVDKNKENSIVVWRSQLPIENEFYSDQAYEEIEEGSDSPSAADFHKLCVVCGCPGSMSCSVCKQRNYCSKNHQIIDWKKAHKFVCNNEKNSLEDKPVEEAKKTEIKAEEPKQVNGSNNKKTAKSAKPSKVESKPSSDPEQKPSGASDPPKDVFATGDLSGLKLDWGAADKGKQSTPQQKKQKNSNVDKANGGAKSGREEGEKKNKEEKSKKEMEKGGSGGKKPKQDFEHNGIFPEFDIETELEEIVEKEKKEDTIEDLKKYMTKMDESQFETMKSVNCDDKDLKEIEDMCKSLDDKAFKRFKKILDNYPEQIIRYSRNGQPLWVSAKNAAPAIPKCEHCGSERVFELQIMPYVLNLLKDKLLDWGTVAIYSCKASCTQKGYVKEFVHRQDFSE